jgi:hypothetical protein
MASQISLLKVIGKKLEYEIETVSQLTATSVAGIDYGIIEAKWIPTGSLGLPLFGRFSYYHIGLLVLMLVVSSALAWSHLQWILENRKKYVIFICAAALPLCVLIEDITWFAVRRQPIRYDEWTMIKPGWGINIGVTWIPYWYVGTVVLTAVLLWLANKSAEKGYRAYLLAQRDLRAKT